MTATYGNNAVSLLSSRNMLIASGLRPLPLQTVVDQRQALCNQIAAYEAFLEVNSDLLSRGDVNHFKIEAANFRERSGDIVRRMLTHLDRFTMRRRCVILTRAEEERRADFLDLLEELQECEPPQLPTIHDIVIDE